MSTTIVGRGNKRDRTLAQQQIDLSQHFIESALPILQIPENETRAQMPTNQSQSSSPNRKRPRSTHDHASTLRLRQGEQSALGASAFESPLPDYTLASAYWPHSVNASPLIWLPNIPTGFAFTTAGETPTRSGYDYALSADWARLVPSGFASASMGDFPAVDGSGNWAPNVPSELLSTPMGDYSALDGSDHALSTNSAPVDPSAYAVSRITSSSAPPLHESIQTPAESVYAVPWTCGNTPSLDITPPPFEIVPTGQYSSGDGIPNVSPRSASRLRQIGSNFLPRLPTLTPTTSSTSQRVSQYDHMYYLDQMDIFARCSKCH